MEILLLAGLLLIFYGLLLYLETKRKKKYDPFGFNLVTTTKEKCLKCSFVNYRPFKRGDYVFKKTGTCPKCGGQMEVEAVYVEHEKNPKQRRWEEYCKKWR